MQATVLTALKQVVHKGCDAVLIFRPQRPLQGGAGNTVGQRTPATKVAPRRRLAGPRSEKSGQRCIGYKTSRYEAADASSHPPGRVAHGEGETGGTCRPAVVRCFSLVCVALTASADSALKLVLAVMAFSHSRGSAARSADGLGIHQLYVFII
jgi:hypothetical protein